jgi:hypothetical protein
MQEEKMNLKRKICFQEQVWWLTPVIPASWEVEIGRSEVQG